MNKVIFMFLILLFNTNIYTQESNIRYINADIFPVLGKATENTLTRYERLPDSLQQMISPILWNLGCNSAGLAVRFRSNSSTIAAKWEVREDVTLNIMTSTAIKGLDLYCLNEDGKWLFAGSGHPQGKSNQAILATDMLPKEREFMLYLSLYDGITSLAIGIDSLASIKQPQIDSPKQTKPIVFYGTSIMQGGCASRPGMAHTNILERWFNRECINLGFRGNGLLDPEIAEVMAGVDASLFILDFLPNATAKHVKERADLFYSIIRSKHPDVPILFTETICLIPTIMYIIKEKFSIVKSYLIIIITIYTIINFINITISFKMSYYST